ncbi:MAG: ArsA family ATPase [Myxococcales bacterium]|nr:ArsA family ATPase [Myxococcales bacterium]MCB9643685.1 ArsA family ATPase [Myxococcales bacterium]
MQNEHLRQGAARDELRGLLEKKRIVVCCGAGGVGKTTSSAALGVAGALLGRKTLVVTIDPARRLADALGMPAESDTPQQVDIARLVPEQKDIQGTLDFWMVQPFPIFDEMIRTLAPSQEHAERIYKTRIYQATRHLVAGMQEYMAGESLFQFYSRRQYDLIILDTPPSRNAIDFLNAPDQILRFLDSRILRVFAPNESSGFFLNRARKLLSSTFEQVAGLSFLSDTQEFVGLMLHIFDTLQDHADTVRRVLASQEAAHILVTSPDPLALEEALYFQRVLLERKIPFGGFLLNRSLADHPKHSFKHIDAGVRASWGSLGMLLEDAFEKLEPLAEHEYALSEQHLDLYRRLADLAGKNSWTLAAPHLGEDIEDLRGLFRLVDALLPGLPNHEA